MKTLLSLPVILFTVTSAFAEFRTWTREDGKTAELELISVTDAAAGKSGVFKMRNGSTVTLAASGLSAADAKLIEEWKPAAEIPAAVPSVFDKFFGEDLVKLSGRSLKPCKDATRPTKYYLLYYTASWCPPCHKFTPDLVEFYNADKDPSFELVVISSDRDKNAMEDYAKEMKMPWPQLELSKVEKFKKEFPYPGTGIPNLVLADLDGKLIKGSYEGETRVGPRAVMAHLATLLGK